MANVYSNRIALSGLGLANDIDPPLRRKTVGGAESPVGKVPQEGDGMLVHRNGTPVMVSDVPGRIRDALRHIVESMEKGHPHRDTTDETLQERFPDHRKAGQGRARLPRVEGEGGH